ncbi:hypothetical protein JX265_011583 [Neoarthrinium moseri]|uniref:Uncharacterized protein n=1 Tax=Neoarthrinium moseri TaxID=1658444 RepID=A0A9P9WCF9_9PEZI|nr:uncharacterized protein JN550_013618 [Neoarthrinium moseri]KAI1848563.1 hypothetical protein JX266_005422 [Neoarthrinium moseri]KAI1856624.1 hypothetical protein JX265_011583 [Neoarthrinium moseri]KAI1856873.1 hypothetical protein JN550_013618 [Neoarthrinium moseri]
MLPRAVAMRAVFRAAPRQSARLASRRCYASQHGPAKSSDMPWLLGSVGITVPGLAYLLSSRPKKADTHGGVSHHGEDAPPKEETEGGDTKAATKSSQTGQDVPPPPADSSSGSENAEGKRQKHDEDKQTMEEKDTKVATSSSDMPSKKIAGEHPREDPQKGKGDAKQKGSSAEDTSEKDSSSKDSEKKDDSKKGSGKD